MNQNFRTRLAKLPEIFPFRELYRHEMDCQIVHWSWCTRMKASGYLIEWDGAVVGYGIVDRQWEKGTLNEFYVVPEFRRGALPMFREVLRVSKARAIRTQTNDRLLMVMLYDCGDDIRPTVNLFEDAVTTRLTCPGATFRKTIKGEKIFKHHREPVGDWVLEVGGKVVATGGAFFHYNPPYGDVYMEVEKGERGKGYGSFLVQEVKRVCYGMGKLLGARCNRENVASRRTLEKAGFEICGKVLRGKVERSGKK